MRQWAAHTLLLVSLVLVAVPCAASELDVAIRAVVDHMLSTQREDGLFRYDFDHLRGAPTGDDQLTRQAGTLFALAEYGVAAKDPRVAPAVRAGLETLAERSIPIEPGWGHPWAETLGVYDIDVWRLQVWLRDAGALYSPSGAGRLVSKGPGHYDHAFAGTTALAVLAALTLDAADADPAASVVPAWLDGLRVLVSESAGVRIRPGDLREMDFFNGEVWLAYAIAHAARPEDERIAADLARLESHLLAHYAAEPAADFFAWGAMATAARYGTTRDSALARFAAEQSRFVLDARPMEDTADYAACALVEGLASAAWVLASAGDHAETLTALRARIAVELGRILALQIQPGQQSLSLGGARLLHAPGLAEQAGAFLVGPHELVTRTDMNQHCLSALLRVERVNQFIE